MVSQVTVSLALIGLALLMREQNPDTTNIIVGAVVGFWLGEAPRTGRDMALHGNGRRSTDRRRI